MSYHFETDCVSCPSSDANELNRMIDDARDITRATFCRHACGPCRERLEQSLGYERHPARGLTAAGDWHISYHRSTWKGRRCYYFVWSAIEHIFTADPGRELREELFHGAS